MKGFVEFSIERNDYVTGSDAESFGKMMIVQQDHIKNPPFLSVVIPTYNRPELLKRAIKSVVMQNNSETIEIVVVDDSEVPLKRSDLFPMSRPNRYIKYIKNRDKLGPPLSRNVGIYNSDSKFVAFLDDDDEWFPDKTSLQIEKLMKEKESPLSVCYSEDRRFQKVRISRPVDKIDRKTLLKSFNLSSTSSYIVKLDYLEKIKVDGHYFDPELKSGQEYDLAIRLSEYGPIYTVPEILMIQHSPSGGQISENWNKKIAGMKSLSKKYWSEYTITEKLKTYGVINLFRLAKIPGVGNRIYNIIIPIKKIYESI